MSDKVQEKTMRREEIKEVIVKAIRENGIAQDYLAVADAILALPALEGVRGHLHKLLLKRPSVSENRDTFGDGFTNGIIYAIETIDRLASTSAVPDPVEAHPDDIAVDRFAHAMKKKLALSRANGRSGWDDPQQCSAGYLSLLLVEHVEKGDPRDVANFCMMLHQRGEMIADERERYAAIRARKP